ncbi:MAG TPA: efflux RND transporter periplasmic adaptor subunit, partial [Bacteroidetes bacterium]|nr:efflux RND transporter periplasmic adaptor subunit [Bacteroidota bacterium]
MKYPFIIFCFFLFSCGEQPSDTNVEEPNGGSAIPVRLAEVERENVVLSVRATGQVMSNGEARPSFKTGGIIAKMYVKEGQWVKKGQKLAKLDLTEINARTQQAKEAVAKAKRDLQRTENLYADKVATLENLQDARTALKMAEQNVRMGNFNIKYAKVRAPISGKVIKKLVNAGEVIGPGMPVVVILGNSKKDWVVKVGVADRDWARLNTGDRATVRLDAFPGKTFKARVSKLADTGNPGSGTFDVELALIDNVPRLAAGLVASVELFPKTMANQTVIPLDALVETNGFDAKVFTIENNTAREMPVRIAFLHKDNVVVQSGLDGIEKVVTDGAPYLYDGAEVLVV